MINLFLLFILGILGGIISMLIDNLKDRPFNREKTVLFVIIFGFIGAYLPNIF